MKNKPVKFEKIDLSQPIEDLCDLIIDSETDNYRYLAEIEVTSNKKDKPFKSKVKVKYPEDAFYFSKKLRNRGKTVDYLNINDEGQYNGESLKTGRMRLHKTEILSGYFISLKKSDGEIYLTFVNEDLTKEFEFCIDSPLEGYRFVNLWRIKR